MSNARNATNALQLKLHRIGASATFDQANDLRRAEITLHRWAEAECGDSNNYASWAVERDEKTGVPYRVTYPHNGPERRVRIADRERGALVRVARICAELGLHYFHQTDPRGCALYVSGEPLTDTDYTRGIACCA